MVVVNKSDKLAVAVALWREVKPQFSIIKTLVRESPQIAAQNVRKLIVVITTLEGLADTQGKGLSSGEKVLMSDTLMHAKEKLAIVPSDFLCNLEKY